MASDQVTVVVFKDNHAARTFQVPLTWPSKFGLMLGILLGITFLTTFFAIKFFSVARRADPARVQDLEAEVAALKTTRKTLENKLADSDVPAPAPVPQPAATAQSQPLPVPTVTVTVTPTPVAAASPPPAVVHGSALLFSALSDQVQFQPLDPTQTKILIEAAQAKSKGRRVTVKLNLVNKSADGSTQTGRLLMIARGKEGITTFPRKAFAEPTSTHLLEGTRGDYYAVGKMKEIRADFYPVSAEDTIESIDVLLLGSEQQVLGYERLKPIAAKVTPKPDEAAPAPGTEPTPAATP